MSSEAHDMTAYRTKWDLNVTSEYATNRKQNSIESANESANEREDISAKWIKSWAVEWCLFSLKIRMRFIEIG